MSQQFFVFNYSHTKLVYSIFLVCVGL